MDRVLTDYCLAEGESGPWGAFVFFNEIDGTAWIVWWPGD